MGYNYVNNIFHKQIQYNYAFDKVKKSSVQK